MFFCFHLPQFHHLTYTPHSPIVVVLAAVGMSHTLRTFLNPAVRSKASRVQSVSQEEEKHTDSEGKSEAQHARLVSRALITMLLLFLLSLFVVHSTWVTSTAYSSPSVVLASSVRSYYYHFASSSLIYFSRHRTAMAVATSWMTSARLISGFYRTLPRMPLYVCMRMTKSLFTLIYFAFVTQQVMSWCKPPNLDSFSLHTHSHYPSQQDARLVSRALITMLLLFLLSLFVVHSTRVTSTSPL